MKNRWTVTSDKFLNQEQVQQLLEYLLNERDLALARGNHQQAIKTYYMVRALLETGLRVFEFCALINSDFQGQKLVVRHGKGDKPRTVLLTKATANLLKEWLSVKGGLGFSMESDTPLFPSRLNDFYTTRGVQKIIKGVFGRLGFPNSLSVHSLRHTYCSLLLASGKVSIATVKENLGHHSIAVTNLYAHAAGDLSEVELYPVASSQKADLSELQQASQEKKSNNIVKRFLRSTNLK